MDDGIYKIRKGVLQKDYNDLVFDLYKKYPNVAKAKNVEFKKTFSADNPFFKYGKAEIFFVLKKDEVFGHIAAIADKRSGDVGFVGFFECKNDIKCANILFKQAIEFLIDSGKKHCRGPINMSVWQNFRVSYPEKNPPFYLEPFTLEYYGDLFIKNGFIAKHKNTTTIESMSESKIKDYLDCYERSLNQGYFYELLSKKNAMNGLRDIYFLTSRIFKGSYSFYDISEEEFLYLTQQYADAQESDYIFILKNRKKEPVGFFFAAPDIFNPELKRVVLKTMGILPEYRGLGLAKAMFYFIYQNAKIDGYGELIFSTMAVENKRIESLIGKSEVYRKYEVFEKNIA